MAGDLEAVGEGAGKWAAQSLQSRLYSGDRKLSIFLLKIVLAAFDFTAVEGWGKKEIECKLIGLRNRLTNETLK